MRRIACLGEPQVTNIILIDTFMGNILILVSTVCLLFYDTGELTIRKSLEYALVHFGADVYTATSDDEFQRQDLRNYNYIILDPWTWAAKGSTCIDFNCTKYMMIKLS